MEVVKSELLKENLRTRRTIGALLMFIALAAVIILGLGKIVLSFAALVATIGALILLWEPEHRTIEEHTAVLDSHNGRWLLKTEDYKFKYFAKEEDTVVGKGKCKGQLIFMHNYDDCPEVHYQARIVNGIDIPTMSFVVYLHSPLTLDQWLLLLKKDQVFETEKDWGNRTHYLKNDWFERRVRKFLGHKTPEELWEMCQDESLKIELMKELIDYIGGFFADVDADLPKPELDLQILVPYIED